MNFRSRLVDLLQDVCDRNEKRFISDTNINFRGVDITRKVLNNYHLVKDDIYVKSLVLLMDIVDDVEVSKEVSRCLMLHNILVVKYYNNRYLVRLKDQILWAR